MNIEETHIKGLYSIYLTPFRDERGFFVRHFCVNEFNQIDKNFKIEQINHFAHGFQALEDNSEILYLHDEFYNKESESGIKYNEPIIDIKWKMENIFTSEKDKEYRLLDKNFKGIKI